MTYIELFSLNGRLYCNTRSASGHTIIEALGA